MSEVGPYEWGVFVEQGQRSDLLAVKKDIDGGKKYQELYDDHFVDMIRYGRGLKEYALTKAVKRSTFDKIHIHIGPTRVGKSTWVETEYPKAFWLTRPQNRQADPFWDLYAGEKEINLDEFYGWMTFDLLLRICDRFPLTLPIKGGTVVCEATTVCMTSNKHVWEWYPRLNIDALIGRIKQYGKIYLWTDKLTYHEMDYDSYVARCYGAQSANFIRAT